MNASFRILNALIFFVIISSSSIFAQDIEATLTTDDATSGFVVKNNSGDPVLSARGNGNIGIGKLNSSYLFEIGSFVGLGSQAGRSIKISAENQSAGGDAGDITLSSGLQTNGVAFGEAASISLWGGKFSGTGGGIELITGTGEFYGGDIVLKTGNTHSNGTRAGNIELFTGTNTYMASSNGGNFDVTCGWSYSQAGSINLKAGNTDGGNGGNINLTPGIDYNGSNHGLLVLAGSGTYSGTWTNVSDERLKKNITSITNSIEHILQLRPVRYEMKVEEFPEMHLENGEQIGLIAQEVEEVLPEIVRTDKDGMKSVDYSKLSVVLIEATKEQQKKINSLEERIEKLEKLLTANNNQVEQVKINNAKNNNRTEL